MVRDRIRSAADAEAPAGDLVGVARRARVLRVRRWISGATAVVVACAAVAVPLISLRDLRDDPDPRRPSPAGPAFGDGSISFRATDGWSTLQIGTLSACTTTASFAEQDIQQSAAPGPNLVSDCSATAAALPSEGVLVGAYTLDAFRWEEPNVNFPASAIPPTLDPATCGAGQYEGQPEGTTKCQVWITGNDRQIAISIWIGTETPSDQLMATAQEGLDTLLVSEPASLGGDVAFEPAHGWYDRTVVPSAEEGLFGLPTAWTSNVDLASSGDPSPYGLSNDQIRALPANGVIVDVEQWITTRNPLPGSPDFRPLSDPMDLSDARLITGGWEGMPAEDVSRLSLSGVLRGRPIIVQAYFRTTDPNADLIRQAQLALNRLVVVPAAPPTDELRDFGIGMELPEGWHGRLFSYQVSGGTLVATTNEPRNPFSPASAADSLSADDVAIVLQQDTALQDLRWPTLDGPPRIGPEHLCVGCEMLDGGRPPAPGHARFHLTFTSGGRAYDLFVEFGAMPTDTRLDDVNAILATLRLEPNPDPQPAPPGGVAVGSLYDGSAPQVRPDDLERTLSWSSGGRTSLSVPHGWTGWTYLVSDTSDPLNLYVIGSWDVPQGGYCAPLMALQQLPADGALVWIDRYGSSSAEVESVPWPSALEVGPGTAPTLAPTPCTAGAPVQSFTWELDGRIYGVHLAFGPDVSAANIEAAGAALASFTAEA